MAAMDDASGSKKRKREPVKSKPGKLQSAGGSKKGTKPFKSKPAKPSTAVEKKAEPKTPRERRLAAKVLDLLKP